MSCGQEGEFILAPVQPRQCAPDGLLALRSTQVGINVRVKGDALGPPFHAQPRPLALYEVVNQPRGFHGGVVQGAQGAHGEEFVVALQHGDELVPDAIAHKVGLEV